MSEATKIFSFRGEFGQDVIVFKNRCKEEGIVIKNITEDPYGSTPDVQVEIKTTASEDDILNVMRGIVDSHVMIQTLRPIPLADNNLERNYEAE